MTHLSTRILKPSLHESFEEKFVESLEDIHVSRFQAQESEKERKTQDTYGPTSDSTSGQLDLFGASLRMSEATPRWGYGESCPIWKKMVTERSGDCSARRKQARLTNASESSSWQGWATPNTMDHLETRSAEGVEKIASGARKGRKRPSNLREQVDKKTCDIYAKLAGPPAQEKSSTSGKNHGSWATPNAGDGQAGMNMGPKGAGRQQKSLGQDVSKSIGGFNPTMKLNPNWVEQLMGLPIGWTDLGSWATESSHKQQN
jgi:hypothetical protein